MILNPTDLPNASKVKKLGDLASELGTSEIDHMRSNEGEAANYGVYFDDTEYDYMQHLRDLGGGGGGDVVFLEANDGPSNKNKSKGKNKQSLEDALRELDVQDAEQKKRELFDEDFLPSKNLSRQTYQTMQDVPDAIGGFQPDMDPRLREVLEALEDDAYVDDDEDVFQALAKDGEELDDLDFESGYDEFGEDEGWETDDTAKPSREYKTPSIANADENADVPQLVPASDTDAAGEAADVVKNDDWMEDFKAFKASQKTGGRPRNAGAAPSATDFTTTTNGGRKKKRKGALTNPSAYSMTSSSLVRTEQLGILDARFENLEQKEYNPDYEDDDFPDDETASVSKMSAMTGASTSSVQGAVRHDFDDILDDFLGGYSMHGKKHVKKGNWASGTAQLDEIRRELGPARVPQKYGGNRRTAAAGPSRG
ncbi:Low temperature viability protein [Xylariaceae sp. FL0016]|nr:Low temperature viability protein [Xylariaceae sp. FL0016]